MTVFTVFLKHNLTANQVEVICLLPQIFSENFNFTEKEKTLTQHALPGCSLIKFH